MDFIFEGKKLVSVKLMLSLVMHLQFKCNPGSWEMIFCLLKHFTFLENVKKIQ